MSAPAFADQRELAKFAATAERWWDEAGPHGSLHRMNPARVAFIRDAAIRGRDAPIGRPLRGLDVLDVGCGGGILAEPLARLGANVTGIDVVDASLEVARRHAEADGLEIAYRLATAEEVAAGGERFDLVVASEVIEHVEYQQAFVDTLAQLTRRDGVVCISTLNRTWRSWLEAVLGAEYVLGWLPRGTHDWQRFVRPSELARWLRAAALHVDGVAGLGWDPGDDGFRLRRDVAVNYIVSARRG